MRCEYQKHIWQRSGRLIFARTEEDVKFLRDMNGADALLLSHGRILAAKELENDPVGLIRRITHEEIEAILQIMSKEERSKYIDLVRMVLSRPSIRDAYLKLHPADKRSALEGELLANDIVAKAFEILILKADGLIDKNSITPNEYAFLKEMLKYVIDPNRHNYFTGAFWESGTRRTRIHVATANGMRFYQVASKSTAVAEGKVEALVDSLLSSDEERRSRSAEALQAMDGKEVSRLLMASPLWPEGLSAEGSPSFLNGFILASKHDWRALSGLGRAGFPGLAVQVVSDLFIKADHGGVFKYLSEMKDREGFAAYMAGSAAGIFDSGSLTKRSESIHYYRDSAYISHYTLLVEILSRRKAPGRLEVFLKWIDDYGHIEDKYMAFQLALDKAIIDCGREAIGGVASLSGKVDPKRLAPLITALPATSDMIGELVKGLSDSRDAVRAAAARRLLELDPGLVGAALDAYFSVKDAPSWPMGFDKRRWRDVLRAFVAINEARVDDLVRLGDAVLLPALICILSYSENVPANNEKTVFRWLERTDAELFESWLSYTAPFDDSTLELRRTGFLFWIDRNPFARPVDLREKVEIILAKPAVKDSVAEAIDIINSMKGEGHRDLASDANMMIASRCPFNCKMCVTKKLQRVRKPDVPKEVLLRRIDRMRGIGRIRFVGPGETMTYGKEDLFKPGVSQDFRDIVNYAAAAAPEVWVVINGAMIPEDEGEARKLLTSFPKNVTWVLSVDDDHAAEMKRVQKGRRLEALVAMFNKLAAEGVIKAHYYVVYRDDEYLSDKLARYGIHYKDVTPISLISQGGAAENGLDGAGNRDWGHYLHHSMSGDEVATDLYIDMDGDVVTCNHVAFKTMEERSALPLSEHYTLGNIDNMHLAQILLGFKAGGMKVRSDHRLFGLLFEVLGAALISDEEAIRRSVAKLRGLDENGKRFIISKAMGLISKTTRLLSEDGYFSRLKIARIFCVHLPDWKDLMDEDERYVLMSNHATLYYSEEMKVKSPPDGSPWYIHSLLKDGFGSGAGPEELRLATDGRAADGHLSAETVERDLATLVYLGLATKGGKGPAARYRVTDVSPPGLDEILRSLGARPTAAAKVAAKARIAEAIDRPLVNSMKKLKDLFGQELGPLASSAAEDSAKYDRQGQSLILYADDILENAMAMDLEETFSRILSAHNIFTGGKILIYSKNPAIGALLERLIKRADPSVDTVCIEEPDLTARGGEVRELESLVRSARAKGAKEILGVIKGHTARPDELAEFARSSAIPVILVGPEKGIYSFAQAVSLAIEAKLKDGSARGWLIMLPPVRALTEDIKAKYEEYRSSLAALVAA